MWKYLFLFVIFFFHTALPVHAGDLSVVVRPDRMQAHSAPGRILITAGPESTAVEEEVHVLLAGGWSLSSQPASFSVSTSGLPQGVIAWPGISTALRVQQSEVVFPSADLQPGVTYGFFITGGVLSTPAAGRGPSYVWQVRTFSGGSSLDIASAEVPILSSDQISVVGVVPAPASSFSAVLARVTDLQTRVQGESVQYEVSYGSTYHGTVPLVLQAEWGLGAIGGSGPPSVSVFTYKSGTASVAYAGAQPVIDVQSRTITWNIPAFPANTQGTVQFSLEATAGYTGSEIVQTPVFARIITPVVTADSTLTEAYQFNPPVIQVPDQTPRPTENSLTTELSTPYPSGMLPPPTPVATPLARVVRVSVVEVLHDSARIEVQLSAPAALDALYGSAVGAVRERISSPEQLRTHQFEFSNLLPGTRYFLQFSGTQLESATELYLLDTAQYSADLPEGIELLLASVGNILQKSPLHLASVQRSVLPEDHPYEVSVVLPDSTVVSQAELIVQSLDGAEQYSAPLLLTQGKIFVARLNTATQASEWEVFVRLKSEAGMVRTLHLSHLVVVPPLQVIDGSGIELEQVAVQLRQLSPTERRFVDIPSGTLVESNPLYTTALGEVSLALPQGVYEVEVTAAGYVPQTLQFSLPENTYPLIVLESTGNKWLGQVQHAAEALGRYWVVQRDDLSELFASRVVFRVLALCVLSGLVLGGVLAFGARTHLSLWSAFRNVCIHTARVSGFSRQRFMTARVVTQASKPISRAVISVFDHEDRVLNQAVTDSMGRVHLRLAPQAAQVVVTAPGFVPSELPISPDAEEPRVQFVLSAHPSVMQAARNHLQFIGYSLLSSLFEGFLVFALIAEIAFATVIGWSVVLPFFVCTLLTVLLWVVFLDSKRWHGWSG